MRIILTGSKGFIGKNLHDRLKIYGEEIHKAFDKLAENIINTFKFTYFDYGFNDIKHEVVAFMVINMHKYEVLSNMAPLLQK